MALENLTPATRLESILNGDDIAPVTREEYFLQKAASGSGEGGLPEYTSADLGKVLTVGGTSENPAARWEAASGAFSDAGQIAIEDLPLTYLSDAGRYIAQYATSVKAYSLNPTFFESFYGLKNVDLTLGDNPLSVPLYFSYIEILDGLPENVTAFSCSLSVDVDSGNVLIMFVAESENTDLTLSVSLAGTLYRFNEQFIALSSLS